jgi:arabinogalactan endo-1,4-beta-galactosidase
MKNKNKIILPIVISAFVISLVAIFVLFVLPRIQAGIRNNADNTKIPVSPTTDMNTTGSTEVPVSTAASLNIVDSSSIHINPIEGLSPDFIMGADVSMLKQIEISGGKYYVNGVEEDCLKVLKDHGVNWIRLRIWNDPTDAKGTPLGGGNNDLEKTVEIAARAKALGLKVLLDFHYSDWWADPGQQKKPKAWEGFDSEQLQKAVYDYTAGVIQALDKAKAMPDMVEIGNEVNNGMIWPDGKITKQGAEAVGDFDGFANLLTQGIQAVRDNDPNNDKPAQRVRIVIHLANGGNNGLYRTIFDALTERKLDFDVIGLSYYSYWHGTLDELKANMNDISERYQKDVIIAETAYAFTTEEGDGHSNLFGEGSQTSGGYKATIQGQATAVHDVIGAVAQVPNARGLGIFYWEPDWIPVTGAGWKTGEGNAWENQAMFDFKGNALPSINVFDLVYPKQGRTSIPAAPVEIIHTGVKTHIDELPVLPTEVKATFSDDSIRNIAVTWEAIDPVKLKQNGSFSINGTVAGTDMGALANVIVNGTKSLVENPGFETGDLAPWVVEGDTKAVNISNEAQNVKTGKYALHYWLNDPFTFTLTQKITGLANGTYTLSAVMQGGGGEESIQLVASGYGGDTLTARIVNTGWQQWQNPTIKNIQVTNGECTVGLKVIAKAGNWAFFDDVSLTREK